MMKNIRLFLAIVLVSLAISMPALADDVYARIRGTITDATGAGVPDVKITAANSETGFTKVVNSGTDGNYEFLNLPPGPYDVNATKQSFKTSLTRGLTLVLNQTFVLNLTLEIGQVTESVQVEAHPVQVELTNTQLTTVIEAQKIVDLPLINRNWVQLQQLAPGVVATSDRFASNFATNGSQSQQNSFTINGTDSNDLPLNTPLIIPSPDAIAEFNLVTNTINPEYGRNSGAVLNAIIKSGTNGIHGSAFEFYRDTFLNARSFFQATASKFHQNQFGGTVGGPVWKDHTFFFLSYQGIQAAQPQPGATGNVQVFTQDQRNGIFPGLASSTATSPFALVGENGATYAAGTAYKTIFPTGHIPLADYNSISRNLLNTYVPLPNVGSFYQFNPTTINSSDQGIARIDHTIGTKDNIFGSYFIQRNPQVNTLPFTGSTLPGFGDQSMSNEKQLTLGWNHSFTPTTLNEFRLGYTRLNFVTVIPQVPVLPSTLGFAINPQNTAGAGAPFISITGLFNLGFSTNGPQPRIDETYQLTDNFSKVLGSHTIKFGFDGRRFGVHNPFFGQNNGSFAFGGNGAYSTGVPGADFLLGIPDSYGQGSGGFQDVRAYEYYFYVQDSWRIRPNLTVNYGVGYQIDTPLENQHFNRLDKNCVRPGEQSTVFPTAPVGLVFPGDPGCTVSGYTPRYGHFGPRIGVAWSPNLGWLSGGNSNKFSIRSGFGVYYNRSEEELALQDLGSVPFSLSSGGITDINGNLSPSFAAPFTDIRTGQSIPNKFPFAGATKGQNVDFSFFEPLDLNVIDPKFTAPYAMNYNFTIQRELPSKMIMTVGYVGSVARHLINNIETNPITLAGAAACLASPSCVANRTFQHPIFPTHSALPGDIFASAGQQSSNSNSNYNSLQVTLRKQLTHGLDFLAAYTWSHSLDVASSFENGAAGFAGRTTNPFNTQLNYGDSLFDARQRLVVSYVYELPSLGHGAIMKRVFGGWKGAGITTLQTGFPLTVSDSGFRSLTCDAYTYYGCWDGPNVLGPVATNNDPRTSTFNNKDHYWFNPADFARQAIGTFGNAGRGFFHGPGLNNTDFALLKDTNITERMRMEWRLEGYNVFNHTQFANPVTNIASSNFGRITATNIAGRRIQLAAKFYF